VSAEVCIGFLSRCGEASARIVAMPEITAATHAAFLCFSSRIWREEARDLEEEDVSRIVTMIRALFQCRAMLFKQMLRRYNLIGSTMTLCYIV
jgi:hypothetical protein